MATTVVVHLPLGALGGGLNSFLAALVLMGAATFLVRRQSRVRLVWCVAVPAAVFLALTAPYLHRGAEVDGVAVGAYTGGYTILVAMAAAAGALSAQRRRPPA